MHSSWLLRTPDCGVARTSLPGRDAFKCFVEQEDERAGSVVSLPLSDLELRFEKLSQWVEVLNVANRWLWLFGRDIVAEILTCPHFSGGEARPSLYARLEFICGSVKTLNGYIEKFRCSLLQASAPASDRELASSERWLGKLFSEAIVQYVFSAKFCVPSPHTTYPNWAWILKHRWVLKKHQQLLLISKSVGGSLASSNYKLRIERIKLRSKARQSYLKSRLGWMGSEVPSKIPSQYRMSDKYRYNIRSDGDSVDNFIAYWRFDIKRKGVNGDDWYIENLALLHRESQLVEVRIDGIKQKINPISELKYKNWFQEVVSGVNLYGQSDFVSSMVKKCCEGRANKQSWKDVFYWYWFPPQGYFAAIYKPGARVIKWINDQELIFLNRIQEESEESKELFLKMMTPGVGFNFALPQYKKIREQFFPVISRIIEERGASHPAGMCWDDLLYSSGCRSIKNDLLNKYCESRKKFTEDAIRQKYHFGSFQTYWNLGLADPDPGQPNSQLREITGVTPSSGLYFLILDNSEDEMLEYFDLMFEVLESLEQLKLCENVDSVLEEYVNRRVKFPVDTHEDYSGFSEKPQFVAGYKGYVCVFYETPLHAAAKRGFHEVIYCLLAKGARIDVSMFGQSPLVEAVRNNHVECVDALLAANADPLQKSNISSVSGLAVETTPLHDAFIVGNERVITLILEAMKPEDKGFVPLGYFQAQRLLTVLQDPASEWNIGIWDIGINNWEGKVFGKWFDFSESVEKINRSSFCYLRSLELPSIFFRNQKITLRFCEMSNGLTDLIELNLSRQKINDDLLENCLSKLQNLVNLKRLNLASNLIGNPGFDVLIKFLRGHRNITNVNLENNSIQFRGGDVVKFTAEALGNDHQIVRFNIGLNWSTVDPEGWQDRQNSFIPVGADGRVTIGCTRNVETSEVTVTCGRGIFFSRQKRLESFLAVKDGLNYVEYNSRRAEGDQLETFIDPNQWRVGLACRKDGQHAFILLEGMRENGLRFLERYEIGDREGNCLVRKTAKVLKPKLFKDGVLGSKFDEYELSSKRISAENGMLLKRNIEREYEETKNTPLNFSKIRPDPDGERGPPSYNCLSWCRKRLEEVDVNVLSNSLFPLFAATGGLRTVEYEPELGGGGKKNR